VHPIVKGHMFGGPRRGLMNLMVKIKKRAIIFEAIFIAKLI